MLGADDSKASWSNQSDTQAIDTTYHEELEMLLALNPPLSHVHLFQPPAQASSFPNLSDHNLNLDFSNHNLLSLQLVDLLLSLLNSSLHDDLENQHGKQINADIVTRPLAAPTLAPTLSSNTHHSRSRLMLLAPTSPRVITEGLTHQYIPQYPQPGWKQSWPWHRIYVGCQLWFDLLESGQQRCWQPWCHCDG